MARERNSNKTRKGRGEEVVKDGTRIAKEFWQYEGSLGNEGKERKVEEVWKRK